MQCNTIREGGGWFIFYNLFKQIFTLYFHYFQFRQHWIIFVHCKFGGHVVKLNYSVNYSYKKNWKQYIIITISIFNIVRSWGTYKF